MRGCIVGRPVPSVKSAFRVEACDAKKRPQIDAALQSTPPPGSARYVNRSSFELVAVPTNSNHANHDIAYLVPTTVGALDLAEAVLPPATAARHSLRCNANAHGQPSPERQPNNIIGGQESRFDLQVLLQRRRGDARGRLGEGIAHGWVVAAAGVRTAACELQTGGRGGGARAGLRYNVISFVLLGEYRVSLVIW
jgi:hypothetical protein